MTSGRVGDDAVHAHADQGLGDVAVVDGVDAEGVARLPDFDGLGRGELLAVGVDAPGAHLFGPRPPILLDLAQQDRPGEFRRRLPGRDQRRVLEARQQRRRQRRRPAPPQGLDGHPRGFDLAALAGLDLDIAAEPKLGEAGDRLLEGRHVRRQLGARRLGHQPVDPHGPLERVIVHDDGHAIGRQLDVDLDPGGAAAPGFPEGGQRVFRGIGRRPAMTDDFRQLQH